MNFLGNNIDTTQKTTKVTAHHRMLIYNTVLSKSKKLLMGII